MNSEDYISLPDEIVITIFSLLNYFDLRTAGRVCKSWRRIADDDLLWGKLYNNRWGDSEITNKPTESATSAVVNFFSLSKDHSVKSQYIKRHFSDFGISTSSWSSSVQLYLVKDSFISGKSEFLEGEAVVHVVSPIETSKIMLHMHGWEVGVFGAGKQTYTLETVYFDRTVNLLHTKLANKEDKNDSPVKLEKGVWHFPFRIPFPMFGDKGENLPSTLALGPGCKIEYKVSVTVHLPFLKINLHKERPITVRWPFDLRAEMRKSEFLKFVATSSSLLFGSVGMQASIAKSVFVVGEIISVTLDIDNRSSRDIKEASVSLIQGRSTKFFIRRCTTFKISVAGRSRQRLILNFQLPPEAVPLSTASKYHKIWSRLNISLDSGFFESAKGSFVITIIGDTFI